MNLCVGGFLSACLDLMCSEEVKSSVLWFIHLSNCCSLIQTDRLQPNRDTVFFRDGVRRIDFVLAYIDDKDERKQVSCIFYKNTVWILVAEWFLLKAAERFHRSAEEKKKGSVQEQESCYQEWKSTPVSFSTGKIGCCLKCLPRLNEYFRLWYDGLT